jgi:small subunit ribosomal protein S5
MEALGVSDILTKCIGTKNPNNVLKATFQGLQSIRSVEDVARVRGKKPEEILAQ